MHAHAINTKGKQSIHKVEGVSEFQQGTINQQ